jgi:3-oxocholest-4-en-26-oyl-CoA dehydrogenase alpha subunit
MEFSLSDRAQRFRADVRRIIREAGTPEVVARQHATGTFNSYEVNRALAAEGLLSRSVPGMGSGDPIELWLLFNELDKSGVGYDGISVALLAAAVINHVGSEHQKQTALASILTGEALVSLGYSEPDYGSDVASIVTRAVRDGDEWVINGAKMWTSLAHEAKWILLLTRTDPDVPKHKGLTMFLMPMDTPGITVEPVHTMGSERTNATFYDNVRVGHECVLGDVNGGWRTMGVALAFERGVMGGTATGVPLLRHFHHWARAAGLLDEPIVRERLTRIAIDNVVASLLTQKAAWIAASGGLPGLEGSMVKVFATEAYQKAAAWCQQMAGPAGLLGFDEPGAAADGYVDYDARHAPVTTIYGGTSEINRNNIAERHLGFPKAR